MGTLRRLESHGRMTLLVSLPELENGRRNFLVTNNVHSKASAKHTQFLVCRVFKSR